MGTSANTGTAKASSAAHGGRLAMRRSIAPHSGNPAKALKHRASGSQPHSSNSNTKTSGSSNSVRSSLLVVDFFGGGGVGCI